MIKIQEKSIRVLSKDLWGMSKLIKLKQLR